MERHSYGFRDEMNLSFEFLEAIQEESWISQSPNCDSEGCPPLFYEGAEGGHKLFAAVLNRAIRDYTQYLWREDYKLFLIAQDAWQWLMSDDESRELTTFVDVCKLLGQDPYMVRSKIARLVENERKSPGAIPGSNAA